MKQVYPYVFVAILLLMCTPGFSMKTEPLSLPLTQGTALRNTDPAFNQIRRALNQALKNNDSYEVAMCYGQIGQQYYAQSAYLQALENFYQAESLFRKLNHTVERAAIWIRIGETHFYNGQYDRSLDAFNQALSLYTTAQHNEGIADAQAHIGQVYEKKGDLWQAQRYQYQALNHLPPAGNRSLAARIYENIGSIYEDRYQLDSAALFFRKALHINDSLGDPRSNIVIINNLGDIFRKQGHHTRALQYTRQAAALSAALSEHYQLASAYRDLAKTFALTGQHDSAYYYSEKGRDIYARIFPEDNAKRLNILQTMFELEQKDDAITQYERERKIHAILLIFGAAIMVLLLFLAISIISRQRLKIANEKKLSEQKQKLFDIRKGAMETELHNKQLKAENLRNELELKGKELTTHTLHLIQKNQLLEELKDKLAQVIKSEKRDPRKELKELLQRIQINHNQDKSWEDFRLVFERVHEHFFDQLHKHGNALTPADLRLAALLKMKLGSADIATMLGISQDSLRISRYRLRKKLNLPEGESLGTFIQHM